MIDHWFLIIDDWKWWSGGGATKNPEDVDLAKFGEKTKTDPRWIYDEDRSGPGTIIFMIDNEFWWWWWLWWIYNGDWSLVGAIKIMNTTKMTIVTTTQEIVLLFDIVLMIVLIFEIVLRTMTIVMIRNLFFFSLIIKHQMFAQTLSATKSAENLSAPGHQVRQKFLDTTVVKRQFEKNTPGKKWGSWTSGERK